MANATSLGLCNNALIYRVDTRCLEGSHCDRNLKVIGCHRELLTRAVIQGACHLSAFRGKRCFDCSTDNVFWRLDGGWIHETLRRNNEEVQVDRFSVAVLHFYGGNGGVGEGIVERIIGDVSKWIGSNIVD